MGTSASSPLRPHHSARTTALDPPEGVELESAVCPLHPWADAQTVMVGFDRLHGIGGRFNVRACAVCGLMRTDPRPTERTIHAYYTADYAPHDAGTAARIARSARGQPKWKKALRQIVPREPLLPDGPPGNFFEIGCGAGSVLEVMRSRGWRTFGVETSRHAVEAARRLGHNVHHGSVSSAPEPDEPYDALAAIMVLEHLHDPVGSLSTMRRWSHPGTQLVITVPNAGSYERRFFGDAWFALQLPTHLWHFTPGTIERILAAAGWSMDRIVHQANLGNALSSTAYLLRDAGFDRAGELLRSAYRRRLTKILTAPIAKAAARLEQTGRMTVFATPR
jgi:SAM-dependent methyltransferase